MNLRLKDLILKTTSSLIIGYMLMGNVCISGIGLAKVIAEEIQNFDISIKDDTVRYVQYNQENYKGVILQEKIVVSENSDANNYAPIQRMEYQIELPRINNVLPERINILKANTELTKPNADNFNQNYDMNTGILNISYENNKDKDGNCYSEYKANANDDFEIIYIYPQEAYLENSPEIDINTKIKTKVNYYSENEIKTIEKSEESKRKQKENVGEIVSLDTTSISDIYKGYMYSNEENKTKYSTNYEIKSNLNILNSQITDEIKINLSKSDYIINQNKIVSTDTIIYHVNKINENDFNKILGENGYIEAYIANQKYATIRYLDADEQGNRKFATVYENEEKTNDEEAGRIVYQDNVKDVILKTSKPITEGSIEIQTQKSLKPIDNIKIKEINSVIEKNKIEVIKRDIIEQEKKDESGNLVYDENGNIQKQQIEKITQIETKENAGKIILKEPTTQMSMEINNNNISTLTNNKIALTIKMDDTNSSCNLFKAGKLEITLPQNLVSSKITNAQSLYTNGLQVTNAKIENGKVILDVQGKQTNYDIQNISGGVNIIVELELDINDSTPTHEETLQATFNNTSVSQKVNIVSKEGVLNYTRISGYSEKETVTTVDESEKIANLEVGTEKKQVIVDATIVNNYDNELSNVEIIGKIPATGNKDINGKDIGSNIDTKLATTISVDNKNVKVYYSSDTNAKSNNNSWTEKPSNKSVAYKIQLPDNIMESKEKVSFSYKFEIPENLTYNEKAINTYSMKYNLNGIEQDSNSTITLKTAATQQIETKIQPNIDLDYVTGRQIVEYTVTAENKSDFDVENLKFQIPIPEGMTYCEYTSEMFEEYTQGGYKPNESIKNKEYNNITIKAGEKVIKRIFLKIKDVSEETIINNTVNLINDNGNIINTFTYQTKVKPQQIRVENVYPSTNTTSVEGNQITYRIPIKNNSNEEIKKVKIIDQLDKDLEIIRVEDYFILGEGDNTLKYTISADNKLEIPLDNIKANEYKLIDIIVRIKNKTGYSERNIGNKVRITGKNIYDHESEIAYYSVKGFNLNLKFTTTAKTNIKEYENIEYIIKLENNSNISRDIKIVDELPSEIKPENYTIYSYETSENKTEKENGELGNQKVQILTKINQNEKLEIHINCKVSSIGEKESVEITNKATIYYGGYDPENEDYIETSSKTTNTITNIIEKSKNQPNTDGEIKYEPSKDEDDNGTTEPDDNNNDNGNNSGNNTGNNTGDNNSNSNSNNNQNNNNSNNNQNNGNNVQETKKYTYTIRGKAWIDTNNNGKREDNESGISNIKVILINNDTGNVAINTDSNQITTYTLEDGSYVLERVKNGNYMVVFEYDTNTYIPTSYKMKGVEENLNSDAIKKEITINGEKKVRAITDIISITNSGISNIDVGFIKNAKFDLSLNKQISSITVSNSKGTKTTNYKDKNFAKIDLVAKYMNNTNLIIKYKFTIKNEGEVIGYVNRLTDNLPSGLEFPSELNEKWYKDDNGDLHTNSLSGIEIQPGESKTIELILTKKTTESTTGTFTNNAELSKISNIEAIQEKEGETKNNKSSVDLVISIKTGSVIMYIGITLLCLSIIGLGIFIIKNRILREKK